MSAICDTHAQEKQTSEALIQMMFTIIPYMYEDRQNGLNCHNDANEETGPPETEQHQGLLIDTKKSHAGQAILCAVSRALALGLSSKAAFALSHLSVRPASKSAATPVREHCVIMPA